MREGGCAHALVQRASTSARHRRYSDDVTLSRVPDPKALPAARAYLLAAALVAGTTAIGRLLLAAIALSNVALLYLVPVMIAAASHGLRAGLFTGLLSSLAYNFFFLPPTGTLTVSNPDNVISLLVFLGVAIVTSQFAARMHVQAALARSSARQNATLAGFSGQLTASASAADIHLAICAEIARLFDVRTVLMTAGADGLHMRAATPSDDRLDEIERAAAQWALDHGQPAGRGSAALTASDRLFHPIRSKGGVRAVIGLAREDAGEPVPTDRMPLLMGLLDQAGIALDRAALEEEMLEAGHIRERDRLRAALLSSVSHDLRTPLTTILSAAQELTRRHDPALAQTLHGEAQRLNRFVANLLDMARVEAGALPMRLEATDLADAVASAIDDMRVPLTGYDVAVALPPDLPLVRADPTLLHHILINLIDNAVRHGDAGAPIMIRCDHDASAIALSVIDRGPGIPPGREAQIFDTFTRFAGSDRARTGTGLGLAIVKAFADAMGMIVTARTLIDPALADPTLADPVGACFTLTLPPALILPAPPVEGSCP
jgi:two-component system sensor histidine kinase KdpD